MPINLARCDIRIYIKEQALVKFEWRFNDIRINYTIFQKEKTFECVIITQIFIGKLSQLLRQIFSYINQTAYHINYN